MKPGCFRGEAMDLKVRAGEGGKEGRILDRKKRTKRRRRRKRRRRKEMIKEQTYCGLENQEILEAIPNLQCGDSKEYMYFVRVLKIVLP